MGEHIDFQAKGVTGSLYYQNMGAKVGYVHGPGILGSGSGPKEQWVSLTDRLEIPIIVLDPPSHRFNEQDFSFGNYATAQRVAANYLKEAFNVERVIGGGHSGGPVAGLFANMGYSHNIERRVIEYAQEGNKGQDLNDAIPIDRRERVFDGLVVASLPRDVRAAMPGYAFNRAVVWFFHNFLFRWQNRGNPAGYIGKDPERPIQWKHLAVSDLKQVKDYMSQVLNPHEVIDMLDEGDNELVTSVRETPKLFLVPGRDIVNFGPKVMWPWRDVSRDLAELREQFETLGIQDKDYHEFPRAAHFLNSVDKFEVDSLYGLKAPEVQDLIVEFIERFK
jgi:hypothetical protein